MHHAKSAYVPRRPYVPLPTNPYARFLAYGTERKILWDVECRRRRGMSRC
ncbi:hypothetical protein HEP84_51570 [Streptomyces sp. RLB1-33]|nr:hypothetical protein [Streptomyces sp. RLB1-33]QIY76117.1 hypothetical protein HEP84_51570 [Streptomyces sp. RLB1-33]